MSDEGPPNKRQRTSVEPDGVTTDIAEPTANADHTEPIKAEEQPTDDTAEHATNNGTGSAAPQTSAEPNAPNTTKHQSGAYTQREEFLMEMEATGQLAFRYVQNDGQPQNMIWLISLKNIFSKQLPNMPKEYISRLVLDRRHRSVVLVRQSGLVLGGITYRAFHAQQLGEIAFCAVTATEQVKGFGTRLMNYTKQYAREMDNLTHFLTYADNNAVEYFQKQGFTTELTLDRERWVGYIKDYDGGTLMECIIHGKISHSDLPGMIKAQRVALDAKIRTLSRSHIVYPGLSHWEGGRLFRAAPEQIPGVLEAGYNPASAAPPRFRLIMRDGPVECTPETLQRFMVLVLKEVQRREEAWPFQKPVDGEEVPDYYEIITDAMDLSLIEKRLQSGAYYTTLDIFAADFKRIFTNARLYNADHTIYYKLANQLEAFFEQYLTSHVIFNK